MAETFSVRVDRTGEEYIISDVEPLESAELFWQISDAIWGQKPADHKWDCFTMGSEMPVLEAKEAIDSVLGNIDKNLVVPGVGKAIRLNGYRAEESVTVSPGTLANPSDSCIGTYNWDEQSNSRVVVIDGVRENGVFTGQHKDRVRQLYASFNYRDEHGHVVTQLTYSMLRSQVSQNRNVKVSANFWHRDLDNTGYEGDEMKSVLLSTEQELRVLRVFQAMGGIALDSPTEQN